MINEETARATAKLAALCAKAEHCTGEMDKKLRQWGISAEDRQTVIDYLVTNHYADVYTPVLDRVPDSAYLEQLKPLLRAKWPTIKADSDYERSMKLIKFGMGRGYSLDLIRQCIDSVSEEDLDGDGELD